LVFRRGHSTPTLWEKQATVERVMGLATGITS
jgi:hypothetical protein